MSCDPAGNNGHVPYCKACGVTLQGWLTESGVSGELDYYEAEGAKPVPEDIHVVSMVLWNLQWSDNAASLIAWGSITEQIVAKLPVLAT